MTTYRGSCHCGAVSFEIEADVSRVTVCDCSMCTRKGIVHLPVPDDGFTLLGGESAITVYRFGSGTAEHCFCSLCGIHTHGRPRSNPNRFTVNARCLDDYERIMESAEVRPFDGKNHPKDLTG